MIRAWFAHLRFRIWRYDLAQRLERLNPIVSFPLIAWLYLCAEESFKEGGLDQAKSDFITAGEEHIKKLEGLRDALHKTSV